MSPSLSFTLFSVAAIFATLGWAILQARKAPTRSLLIGVPFVIAAIQLTAYFLGKIARDEQAAIVQELSGRKLTPNQVALLKSYNPKTVSTVVFDHRLMDGEGKEFATQLAEGLSVAGWKTRVVGNFLDDLPGRVTVAVAGEDQSALVAADDLCNFFTNSLRIKCGGDIRPGSLGGSLDAGTIYLIVGRK